MDAHRSTYKNVVCSNRSIYQDIDHYAEGPKRTAGLERMCDWEEQSGRAAEIEEG